MPSISVVFDADTGKFVSNVAGAEKSVIKASEAVAQAKNQILSWGKAQVEQAQAAGRSFEQLERIQTQTAQRLASVTESNATRVINAMDRQQAKAKALAAELANVNRVAAVTRPESHDLLAGITQRQQASAIIRAGSGSMSIRAAESFATLLPGFEAVAGAVFPIVGAAAFGAEIYRGVEALAKMRDEQEKVKESQQEFGIASAEVFKGYREQLLQAGMRADELRGDHIGALRKEMELLDMQGLDNLMGAFTKLAKISDDTLKTVKANWLQGFDSTLRAGLGMDYSGTDKIDRTHTQFGLQYRSLLADNKPTDAQNLLNKTQQEQSALFTLMGRVVNFKPTSAGGQDWDAITQLKAKGLYSSATSDFAKIYQAQQTLVEELTAAQTAAADQRKLTGLNRSNTLASANRLTGNPLKEQAETLMQGLNRLLESGKASGRIESPGDVQDFWANATGHRSLSGGPASANPYLQDAAQKEYNAATIELNKQLKTADAALAKWSLALDEEGVKKLQQEAAERLRMQREQQQAYVKAQKGAADDQIASARLLYAHGYIGSRDAAQQELSAYQRLGQNTGLTMMDTPEGAQLRAKIAELEEQLEPPINKLFDSIRRNAQDTSDKIEKITEKLISDVNDNVVSTMFGERTDWSGAFRNAGKSLAKTGLEKAEGLLFGGGKKANGYNVWVDNLGGAGTPGTANTTGEQKGLLGAAGKSLLGFLNDSDWASGLFGGKLFGSGSFFGGGKAIGGSVNAGTTYLIGERGPELFRPGASGSIVPNHMLGGSNSTYHIDARGTDPAMTQVAVQRAMVATHAQAVRDAGRAMADRQRRTA
jgi:hypothetical protein